MADIKYFPKKFSDVVQFDLNKNYTRENATLLKGKKYSLGDIVAQNAQGKIVDSEGKTVSIVGPEGSAYVTGDSVYTVTVLGAYADSYDGTGAGTASSFSDYAVQF